MTVDIYLKIVTHLYVQYYSGSNLAVPEYEYFIRKCCVLGIDTMVCAELLTTLIK